jgi:hypothetical protein
MLAATDVQEASLGKRSCIVATYSEFTQLWESIPTYVRMFLPTNLTPWNWVLAKPPVIQLLKNFLTVYGTRRLITVFKRALHWSLTWGRIIQSIPPHSISLRPSHLRLGLPSCLFPCGFPTKTLCSFLFSPHLCHIPHPSHFPWWIVIAVPTGGSSGGSTRYGGGGEILCRNIEYCQ